MYSDIRDSHLFLHRVKGSIYIDLWYKIANQLVADHCSQKNKIVAS